MAGICENATTTENMKGKVIKYAIGFAIFLGYYIVARNLENRIAVINKLTNFGS